MATGTKSDDALDHRRARRGRRVADAVGAARRLHDAHAEPVDDIIAAGVEAAAREVSLVRLEEGLVGRLRDLRGLADDLEEEVDFCAADVSRNEWVGFVV